MPNVIGGESKKFFCKKLGSSNRTNSGLKNLKQKYKKLKCWGILVSIDLYKCKPEFIRQPKKIKEFIFKLCSAIKMKRYGAPMIKKFGEGDLLGHSALQFIETSSITLHFDETKDRAFIEIFSCKYFEPEGARQFCQKFLGSKKSKLRYYLRH
ncbi:MAG: S-adenosylmethionine decarboxylase [bacterium]|nr:S-adenosylmethionine decarboxylase [bacterium]